jgi:transcriptional regulator with XRE-family HTH domain
MNQLGNFIEQKRKELGLSLRSFADMCNISHSYLDNLEKGVDVRSGKPVSPTIETLQKLASGLNLSLIDLLKAGGYINSSDNASNFTKVNDDELIIFIREISPDLSPEDKRDLTKVIKLFIKKAR